MAKQDENLLNELSQLKADPEVTETESVVVPGRYDPEWSDYVMTQFDDSEVFSVRNKDNKETGRYPKVAGLRRLTGKILGHVISSKPALVNLNYGMDGEWVSATYVYEIQDLSERIY